jgi:hypothetical protein
MSQKKTGLAKQMASKLHGQMKDATIPQRFGKQSAAAAKPDKATASTAPKLVPVTCRLPADLAQRLREHALTHEGGIHGLLAEAASNWLASTTNTSTSTKKAPSP